jgi:hypothetical protein
MLPDSAQYILTRSGEWWSDRVFGFEEFSTVEPIIFPPLNITGGMYQQSTNTQQAESVVKPKQDPVSSTKPSAPSENQSLLSSEASDNKHYSIHLLDHNESIDSSQCRDVRLSL